MLVCHTAQCISIAEREAPVVCPHMMPPDNCANTKRSRPSQKRKSGALAGQGNHIIIIFAEIDINSDNIWHPHLQARDYQLDAVSELLEQVSSLEHALSQHAPGSGKTETALLLIFQALHSGLFQ